VFKTLYFPRKELSPVSKRQLSPHESYIQR
jgi:hypothetical protein